MRKIKEGDWIFNGYACVKVTEITDEHIISSTLDALGRKMILADYSYSEFSKHVESGLFKVLDIK